MKLLKMAMIKPMKKATFKVSSKFLIHFYSSKLRQSIIISSYLFENEFICLIHCIPQIFPDLVDYLLDTYDSDFNGILDFPEFMKAFEETRAQLGVS